MTKKNDSPKESVAGRMTAGSPLVSRPPVANIPPFGLRMQPELKAMVEKAAVENNRSLNAEIVHRLMITFAFDSIEVEDSATETRPTPIRIVLDATGHPIGVLEASVHISQLAKRADIDPQVIQTVLVSPEDFRSKSDREQAYFDTVMRYRETKE